MSIDHNRKKQEFSMSFEQDQSTTELEGDDASNHELTAVNTQYAKQIEQLSNTRKSVQ